jgi:hypothetical protein
MPKSVSTPIMLVATARNVLELADDILDILAHDPPALDRRRILGLLAHLSRTRERLQKASDWLADVGPTPVVDDDETRRTCAPS